MPRPHVPTADDVLADPAASTWLKNALSTALQRDPVNAANDAALLCFLLDKRADDALASARAAQLATAPARG